ncbi:hypothetical protein HNQ07_001621 [Deinococcus metalli]|nr:hypothetical protein [Deinococcus metalli]MBB5376164.1 hypothetical protein [Deinococcus metalli]
MPPVSRITPPSPVGVPAGLAAQGIDPLALPAQVLASGADGGTVHGLRVRVTSAALAADHRSAVIRLSVQGVITGLRDVAALHVRVTGELGSGLPTTVLRSPVVDRNAELEVRVALPQEGRGDTALRATELPARLIVYTARSGVTYTLTFRR